MAPAIKLSQLLEAAHIQRLAGRGGEEVLLELAELAFRLKWVADAKELLSHLLEREMLGTTAVGEGIAIPHAKVEGVEGVRVALGVTPGGVSFGCRDGTTTRLFFLVLSSPRQPSLHIRVLAQISRVARTPGIAEHLAGAATPVEALTLLAVAEGRG